MGRPGERRRAAAAAATATATAGEEAMEPLGEAEDVPSFGRGELSVEDQAECRPLVVVPIVLVVLVVGLGLGHGRLRTTMADAAHEAQQEGQDNGRVRMMIIAIIVVVMTMAILAMKIFRVFVFDVTVVVAVVVAIMAMTPRGGGVDHRFPTSSMRAPPRADGRLPLVRGGGACLLPGPDPLVILRSPPARNAETMMTYDRCTKIVSLTPDISLICSPPTAPECRR